LGYPIRNPECMWTDQILEALKFREMAPRYRADPEIFKPTWY